MIGVSNSNFAGILALKTNDNPMVTKANKQSDRNFNVELAKISGRKENVAPKPKETKDAREHFEVLKNESQNTPNNVDKADEEQSKLKSKPETKVEDLTDDQKKVVKELSEKLGISQQNVMNLLQALNINLNQVPNSDSNNVEEITQGIIDNISQQIQKLDTNVNLMSQENLQKDSLHVVLNLHGKLSKDELKQLEEGLAKNIHLNVKITQNDGENSDIEDQLNSVINNILQKGESVDTEDNSPTVVSKSNSIGSEVSKLVASANSKVAKMKVSEEQEGSDEQVENLSEANNVNENQDKVEKIPLNKLQSAIKLSGAKTDKKTVGVENILNNASLINDKTSSKLEALVSKAADANIQKNDIFNQIVDQAKIVLNDNQTEMQLNLKPESLGKISLKIASENGIIVAKITAENEQVKGVIESNLNQLRDSLKQQGLNIQELSVNVGQKQERNLYEQGNFTNRRSTKVQSVNPTGVYVSDNYNIPTVSRNPYLGLTSTVDYSA